MLHFMGYSFRLAARIVHTTALIIPIGTVAAVRNSSVGPP